MHVIGYEEFYIIQQHLVALFADGHPTVVTYIHICISIEVFKCLRQHALVGIVASELAQLYQQKKHPGPFIVEQWCLSFVTTGAGKLHVGFQGRLSMFRDVLCVK